MSGIKLEAGQWYRMRQGNIRYCIGKGPKSGSSLADDFPCLLLDDANGDSFGWYKEDGKSVDEPELDIVEHLPDCTGFDWEPPKPKYRAFKGKDEFYPYRDNWIVRKDAAKDRESVCKILSFSDAGCTVSTCSLHAIKTWEEMLNDWNFAVGTPFGVLDDGT